MGRLAKVLEYFEEEFDGATIGRVKCDLGGERPVTADHYSALGEEEHPLPGDFAFLVEDDGTGRWVAIRFFDPKWTRRAQPGEIVRYSRDASGAPKAIWHLKADGTIDLNSGKAKVSPSGELTCAAEITAMAGAAPVKVSTHQHPTGVGPSGPPTPGT